ncbi:MAG: condensation domain-containing protein [Actinomycetota bacterium]
MNIGKSRLELLASLSPAQRAEFFRLLREERLQVAQEVVPRRTGSSGPAPLSFAQQQLVFLDQMYPGMPTYNVPLAVQLRGPLNPLLLERSLNGLLQRHDILRTVFKVTDGIPMQQVIPDFTLQLQVEDLAGIPASEHEPKARALAVQEGRCPFDIQAAPPIRAKLLRLDDNHHVALITLHHVICDGQSLEILIHDLAALYEAEASGRVAQLPELPLQYIDFVHWQREWLKSNHLQPQIAYWKSQLHDCAADREVPSDFPGHDAPGVQAKRAYFELGPEVQHSLEKVAFSCRTTPMTVLLAAFQVLLKIWSGQDAISIGSPVDNRKRTEFAGLIGFFVNTVIYRTDVGGEITFSDVLSRARETVLSAHAHADVPFELLLKELHGESDSVRAPLFRIWFVFMPAPPQRRTLSGIELTPFSVEYEIPRYDLKLNVLADADGLHGSLEYDTRLFAASTIEALSRQYTLILQRVADEPEVRVRQLAEWLNTIAEKQRTDKQKQLVETNLKKLMRRRRQPSSENRSSL